MVRLVIKDSDTIRKKVYHHIREKILSGKIAPGERLIETRLAQDIGTSRTPVREALHSLELEKLIKSIPRVGYIVEGSRSWNKSVRSGGSLKHWQPDGQ